MIPASRLQLLLFVWCCPLSDPTFDKFPEAAADTKNEPASCSHEQRKDMPQRLSSILRFRVAVFFGFREVSRFVSAVFVSMSISHDAVSGSWAASVPRFRA